MMTEDESPHWDAEWDAGDTGCGELVLFLRRKIQALSEGGVLRLKANDAGAVEDIPAWCGLTGHQLLLADPPYFFIKKA